jgi:DNA (cytosine-5)-methyltransferase 1
MKILNLYACLGGNRYKWDEVADIEVTAVELDPEAARLYKERFPNDTVIIADAHEYLLDHYKEFYKGKYLVENVIGYYEPLISPQQRGRHFYWCNFVLPNFKSNDAKIREWQLPELEKHHQIDLSKYKGEQNKRKMARNLVHFEAGKTILETALNIVRKSDTKQTSIFDYL